MIISVSRRTDIPAYYSPWFWNRLRDGYVLVRQPVNERRVSRIVLHPDVVDGFVFWTKNPAPMLARLGELEEYAYYFQYTLTAYGSDVEPGIPSKRECLIPAFQELSRSIGPERVIWRYDPVFLSSKYTEAYHVRYFAELAAQLAPYTRRCVISFLDYYPQISRPMAALGLKPFPAAQKRRLACALAAICRAHGLQMETCAEELDLAEYGISHGRCIDKTLFEQLLKQPLLVKRDANQRPACGCAESIDIGAYRTCRGGCRYCYAGGANREGGRIHDPASPLLGGYVRPEDEVYDRHITSCRSPQMVLEF